jgi:hypothetical protein
MLKLKGNNVWSLKRKSISISNQIWVINANHWILVVLFQVPLYARTQIHRQLGTLN